MKPLSIILMFFLLTVECFGQINIPDSYPSGFPVNYVRSWTLKAPHSSGEDFNPLPVSEALQTTQYYDGLGRPVQTVIKKGSHKTGTTDWADMVGTTLYDNLGREQFTYLPSPATGGMNNSIDDGLFKYDPFQQQQEFMNNRFGENSFNYSQTVFEPSALSRPIKQMPPGADWVGSGRGISTGYYFNSQNDHVKIFNTTPAQHETDFDGIVNDGEYQEGQLDKTITTDEAGNQVIQFSDKDGLVVLRKVQSTSLPDSGAGAAHTGWVCTYYVYDAQNRLVCVVQPRGVEVLDSLGWNTPQDASFFNEQCFRYKYDVRNQMIQKQVPGSGALYMVYDRRGRLVLSQDAMQREKKLWIYTKYDNLNRDIQTGIFESTLTRADHETAAWDEEVYPANTAHNETILTKTYYDNYNWLPSEGISLSQKEYVNDYDALFYQDENQYPYPLINHQKYDCKGMVTGTIIYSEALSAAQITINKYDRKNRLIQFVTFKNVIEGKDVMTTQYSWNGKVLFNLHHQTTLNVSRWIKILKKFTYDELDRLIITEQKIAKEDIKDGDFPDSYTPISQIAYNELGQVMQKIIPNITPSAPAGILETENYDYNIRGWSLGMNREYFNSSPGSEQDHYFGYELAYNKTNSDVTGNLFSTGQYNGNIAGMVWKSKNKEISRQYDFNYDRLNRFLSAAYSQHDPDACTYSITPNFSVRGLSYDANGNILSMNQMGLIPGHSILIDSLRYQYQTQDSYN